MAPGRPHARGRILIQGSGWIRRRCRSPVRSRCTPRTVACGLAGAGKRRPRLDTHRAPASRRPSRSATLSHASLTSGHPLRRRRRRTEAASGSGGAAQRHQLAFPAGLDDYAALSTALEADPKDAGAHGCWAVAAGRRPHRRRARELERHRTGSADPRRLAEPRHRPRSTSAAIPSRPTRMPPPLSSARTTHGWFSNASCSPPLRGVSGPSPCCDRLRTSRPLGRDDLALGTRTCLSTPAGRGGVGGAPRWFRPFEGGEGKVIDASTGRRRPCRGGDATHREATTLLREGLEAPRTWAKQAPGRSGR